MTSTGRPIFQAAMNVAALAVVTTAAAAAGSAKAPTVAKRKKEKWTDEDMLKKPDFDARFPDSSPRTRQRKCLAWVEWRRVRRKVRSAMPATHRHHSYPRRFHPTFALVVR